MKNINIEIGDRVYGYYICDSLLTCFELIIKDIKEKDIIAITGDGFEYYLFLSNNNLHHKDGFDYIFSTKKLKKLKIDDFQPFKLINPTYK